MPAQIVTTEDLKEFKSELLESIKSLFETKNISGEKTNKKWIKSPDVMKLLEITTGTLQNLRVKGALPYTKIGGTLYYDYDEIQKILSIGNKRKNENNTELES